MPLNLSTLSDAELAALASGKMSGLSDATLAMLAKPDMPIVAPTPAPKAPSTDRTWGEAITDPMLAVAKGGAGILQIPGQIQRLVTGTGSSDEGLEGYGKRSEEIATSWQSEGLKAREAQRSAKLAEAEKEGGASGFFKTLGISAFETIKDPALLSTFLFEQIPQFALTGGVGKAAQGANALRMTLGKSTAEEIAKASLKVGVSANVASGALLQGIDVGSDTYDEIYKYGIANKLSEEAARDLALNKARAAATAAALVSLGAQKLPGARKLEEALLGGGDKAASKLGALGRGLTTGAKEAVSEGIEEGGGAVSKNVAVQQADPTRTLMQGVGTATGLGMVGGAGMGVPIGTMAAMPGKQPEVVKVPEAIVQDALQTGAAPDDVIARIAQVYQNQGILAEEALALATREVAEAAGETPPTVAPTAAPVAPTAAPVDPRVADLFDELTANGVPVAEAEVQAVAQAAEEKQNDAEAAAEEQNATVNPTINGADQRSDGVPVSSDATAGTTASAGTPPVEGTPVVASSTTGGEGAQPAALTPTAKTRTKENTPVPSDEAMRDAGFTTYEIDRLKYYNPNYDTFNLINTGHKYINGAFSLVTAKGVAGYEQFVESKKAEYEEKKKRLDAAFAKEEMPQVDNILGSDWQGGSGVTVETYKDDVYRVLKRQYSSFEKELAGLKRVLAKTQGTETKTAAPVTETKVKTTPAGLVSVKKVELETPVGRRKFEYQVLSPTGEVVSTHGTQVEASTAATAERAKANAVTGKQKAGPKTKLTPEQIVENRKATNAQTNVNKQNTRALEATVKGIKETLNRDLSVIDAADDAEAKTIVEEQGVARVAAIAEAMRITENRLLKNTKEGKAAAELLGHETITDAERLKAINKLLIARGEKALFSLPSRSTKNTTGALSDSTNGNDDAKYLKFETATQALISISKDKNSTSFEKYLSNLLAFFVRDIRIVVVNENTVLPEKVRKEFDADAGGVYFKRVIYLAADGGINNTVFLHEVLHGALNNRLIAFFKATQEGRRIDKKFAAAVENIFSIMESANAEYNALEKVGMLDERLRLLKKGGAFTNIFEFIAYGMSNPVMQEFLLQSEGTYTQKNAPNLFTRFVNGLLDFFGMGPEHKSAMQDLILSTNALLANPTGGPAVLREAARPSAAKKVRAAKVKVDKALEQVAQSNNAGDIGNVVGASADDHDAFKNEAIARWDALNNASQKLMLGAMQTSDILKWKGDEIPGIVGIDTLAQKVASTRDNMLSKFSTLAEPFAKFVRKFGQKTLGDTMHLARLKSVPVTEYKDRADALVNDALVKYYEKKLTSTTLTPQVRGMTAKALSDRKADIGVVFDAWDKLGKQEGGHKTYAMVRKFYIDNKNLTRAVLNRQLDELPIAADAKAELLKSVRLLYENVEPDETGDSTELQKAKQSVQEYFPFSRYGDYWLRVASGTKGTVGAETYFFENGTDRNKFLIRRAKELNISKEDSSVFSIGDDVSVLRKKFSSESIMLQKMFATIDAAKLTTDAERDALKDQLYQTYLLTLPERSIRKQFLHAKERTGFTNEVFRNFQTYSQRYASQIPKLLYGDKIRNAISASRDNIKDQPTTQRGTNELFLNAIARRAEDVLNPPEPNKIVTFSSRFAFLWLLTSPASAATQMATIPIMVLPALNAEYGYAQTAAKTAKYLNIWKSLGKTVVGPNGETTFTAPSVGASQIVTSDPIKQRAFQLGQERSIFMTNTSVLTSTVRSPGSSKASLPGHVLEKTYNIMTALFNGAERISRESTYMMVFELEYAKTKNFDASVNKAVELTHELLFRYDPANRPDILKSNLGRTLLQFKMYAVGMTSFLLRNAYNSMRISGISGQERVKAMHKLAGTLVMGSVFHGLVGMPLYSTICLAIDAVLSALGDDEEEKKRRRHSPLTADNSDMRFRYEYLPENFGTITMPGLDMRQHRLSDVLEKGLISSLTDVNIGSRTSFDNLWFRNIQPGKDWSQTATNIVTSLMGPSASAGVNIVKGIDDFNNGHILRGLEKISPAFFRGTAAAIRMGTEGAETKRGDDMLKPAEINTANLVAQALGFTPARLARIQEQNNAASQELMVAKNKRSALLKRFDEAVTDREGDKSKIKGIIEDIKRHNKRYPSESLVITGDTIDASLTAFINRSQTTIRGQTMNEKDLPMLIRLNRAGAPLQ
jgi:hypothetical protein